MNTTVQKVIRVDRVSTREKGRGGNWQKVIFNAATKTRPGLKKKKKFLEKLKSVQKDKINDRIQNTT